MPIEYQRLNINYVPKQFTTAFNENDGQKIWDFLIHPANYIRYETAVKLRRPPVEVIGDLLAQEFSLTTRSNIQVKQMIGHMIYQIMTALGYRHSSSNCRIQNNQVFSSGAKYEKCD
ncbi:MAG: hypothetical protein PHC34_02960 [Candidatus Gastranaerophilales bacterium]|nr:hypothetical protein [Candidatus Gastranaerophilales bacterium]